jgi:putative colanic acid biosynthesis acetyltransferase WcaF
MGTTRLDRFANPDFQPGPLWARALWLVVSGCFFQTWFPWPSAVKGLLLRGFGAKIGPGLVLKPRVTIKYPWKLRVGSHCWIGEGVWIDNLAPVSLGDHCCLSQGALLICGNHSYKKPTFDLMVASITLEDGVWIGAMGRVAPGVTCRTHSVLAMGGMLTQDMDAWGIYQGNPATRVKTRTFLPQS